VLATPSGDFYGSIFWDRLTWRCCGTGGVFGAPKSKNIYHDSNSNVS